MNILINELFKNIDQNILSEINKTVICKFISAKYTIFDE